MKPSMSQSPLWHTEAPPKTKEIVIIGSLSNGSWSEPICTMSHYEDGEWMFSNGLPIRQTSSDKLTILNWAYCPNII